MLGEFEQIAKIMAPLAQKAKGAFGLTDDAAVFQHAPDQEIVVTTDTLIAGVHFFASDPPETIARKLLGVNLSDLAAMGAQPLHYTLNASYPRDIKLDWLKSFAAGLKAMQDTYGIVLLGGDTTATPGPLCLSLTAFGTVPKGQAIRRTTARVGDLICTSGTIGDGALGLLVAQGRLEDQSGHLLGRYRCPQPRTALGVALSSLATACLDISDGLLTDFTHMKKGGEIYLSSIPLSKPAQHLLEQDSELFATILNGGDDYELLFCVAPENENVLKTIAQKTATPITVIGRITTGEGVRLLDQDNNQVPVETAGYRHF